MYHTLSPSDILVSCELIHCTLVYSIICTPRLQRFISPYMTNFMDAYVFSWNNVFVIMNKYCTTGINLRDTGNVLNLLLYIFFIHSYWQFNYTYVCSKNILTLIYVHTIYFSLLEVKIEVKMASNEFES